MTEREMTPWFPVNVKPHRAGVYEARIPGTHIQGYAYWDMRQWGYIYVTKDAADQGRGWSFESNKEWRGLASDPYGRTLKEEGNA